MCVKETVYVLLFGGLAAVEVLLKSVLVTKNKIKYSSNSYIGDGKV